MDIQKIQKLIDAKVHLGHQTQKWNPKMAPFIFTQKNGVHIIDLNKTLKSITQVQQVIKSIIESGKRIMFVATKKQISSTVEDYAKKLKQPYITKRWLGGTLTNFATIRKSIKKLTNINKIKKSITYKNLAKKEKLMLEREQIKLEKLLNGVVDLNRTPSALLVVDIKNESIAVKEARKLGIPVFGIIDTNSDPSLTEYAIPANDDSISSVKAILDYISPAIEEGLENRKKYKEDIISKTEVPKKNYEENKNKSVIKKITSSSDITDKSVPNPPQKVNKKIVKKVTLKHDNDQEPKK